jgi:hypothetical protein
MAAVQSQEFWGGRWALAVRTRGEVRLSDVDRAFDRGHLVRSWTQRGTIHTCAAEDLDWLLRLTAERQMRLAAGRHRQLGLDEETFHAAERAVRSALRGGGRLTRAEFTRVLEVAGLDPTGQRGIHLLQVLSWRGVVCHGPVVPRPGSVTREQYLVLCEEWITGASHPPDATAELFVRYIDGHGPATAGDFAWWSGLTLTVCREAARVAEDRVRVIEGEGDRLYVSRSRPRVSADAAEVVALPAFDEYYLSYLDRDRVCAVPHQALVGPGANGMVTPLILADGVVAGKWTHSRAVGRREAARAEMFDFPDVAEAAVTAALDRYAAFVAA